MRKLFPLLVLIVTAWLPENFSLNAQKYDGKYEWRAAWIATVNNIDWPSRRGLTAQEQKTELIGYFDLFKKLNFNAIILQIRPTADAYYVSKYEPWSIYLTGNQNVAPEPFYDPLAFAVEEAHKRGMELHAWLNPYRVSQDTANIKEMNPGHIYNRRPDLFVRHENKLYFDPAYPETREFLVKVIKDIATRYDLDGIHFDDYFYPNNNFNDEASFSIHSRGYKAEDKMAWRRENVDMVIEMLRDTIKSVKPYIKYGISPYAVWRNLREDPRGSDTKGYSYTNYDHLHADLLLWMENGWLDYVLPQLYFNMGYEIVDFSIIAKWWQDYSAGTPVYGGIASYKLDAKSNITAWRSSAEIGKQIEMLRSMPGYQGMCYFSAKNMRDDLLGINRVLTSAYPYPALVPQLRGFSDVKPASPRDGEIVKMGKYATIVWTPADNSTNIEEAKTMYHAVYKFPKGQTPDFSKGEAIVALTGEEYVRIDDSSDIDKYDYYVSALNRLFNESGYTLCKVNNSEL